MNDLIIILIFTLFGGVDDEVCRKEINGTYVHFSVLEDSCTCTFSYEGGLKVNEGRYDLFISTTNWNRDCYSCTLKWGELINNEFPPDSSYKDFRIHLLDFKFQKSKITDVSIYLSEIFEDNLIATYSKLPSEENWTCKFDPNNVGKYPKPTQWIE